RSTRRPRKSRRHTTRPREIVPNPPPTCRCMWCACRYRGGGDVNSMTWSSSPCGEMDSVIHLRLSSAAPLLKAPPCLDGVRARRHMRPRMEPSPRPIARVAEELGLGSDDFIPYGRGKAKLE